MTTTNTANADLTTLVEMLREQHVRKVDVVLPSDQVRAVDGDLLIRGVEGVLLDDGVLDPNGVYTPTGVCDDGLADRLGIPPAYLRRLRADRAGPVRRERQRLAPRPPRQARSCPDPASGQ